MIAIDATRRTLLGVLAGTVITGLVACTAPAPTPSSGSTGSTGPVTGSSATVLGPDQVGPLVTGIVNRAGKDLKPERLADGLLPPTNKWFSGLVFGPAALP